MLHAVCPTYTGSQMPLCYGRAHVAKTRVSGTAKGTEV